MGPWLFIFLYLFWITPVQIGAFLAWESAGLPRGALGILIWGIPLRIYFSMQRDPQGHLRLESTRPSQKTRPPKELGNQIQQAYALLKGIFKANRARELLSRVLHLRRFEIRGQIGFPDAAHTALLTGLLRMISSLFPGLRCLIQPAFHDKSALGARCIVACRLGMLLAAVLLGYLSYRLAARKEEKAWIIPSDT